jgi:hypothetical protein
MLSPVKITLTFDEATITGALTQEFVAGAVCHFIDENMRLFDNPEYGQHVSITPGYEDWIDTSNVMANHAFNPGFLDLEDREVTNAEELNQLFEDCLDDYDPEYCLVDNVRYFISSHCGFQEVGGWERHRDITTTHNFNDLDFVRGMRWCLFARGDTNVQLSLVLDTVTWEKHDPNTIMVTIDDGEGMVN